MRATKATLLVLLTSIVAIFSSAQRGKDGTFTVANPNSIVNSYTSLTANAAIGNTSISVTNSALNTGTVGFTYAAPLAQGDLIMIIQTQGAELDINTYTVTGFGGNYTWADTFFIPGNPWVNPWVWGRVKNYNSSGKYEVVEVLSVPNSTTINLTCGLQNNYSVTGKTQIVRIPRFQDLTLANSATIIPTNWLGQTGGVVALEVNGNLTLNSGSKITATGRGFRGATTHFGSQVVSCLTHGNGPGKGNSQLGSSSAGEGAKKGEGIGGYETEYTAVFSTYGRGAAGNGGGGGGYQNSGGGGGSNVSVGTYTGKGVPSTTFANSVWNLESANLGGSASSGGGRGGYSLSTTDQNELTVGPNNSLWCNAGAGDARKENGGFGGHYLAYDATRVFMGGGGGAGDGNNTSQPGAGGNGGGIVFVTCYGTIGGSGSIESDGNVGQNSNPLNQGVSTFPSTSNKKGNDGAGGAGGGGSIIIKNANPIGGTVALFARGGAGGNQVLTIGVGAAWEAAGPGGGGAGGFVAVANGSPTLSVAGGNAGTTNSTQVSNFNVNGATGGAPGVVQTTSFFNLIPTNATICTGATANLSVSVVGTAPGTITWYTQQFGGTAVGTGTSFTTPALSTTTTYYVGTCPGTFRVPVTVTVTSGIAAAFTQLGPFCSGQIYTLPNTSSNGLTGTWSPAINTSTTTNYTFTPTAGQCGLPATMTVVINPAVTPAFTQVAPVCIGTAFTLPTTSTNGITGNWSPAINTSATTTYSFTPTAGQCANATTMTVTVNPNVTPNFVQVAPICSGGSFTLSTTSTNGITGTWSPAINTSATTTYSFTPAAGQCANTTAMTVTVNPNVLPAFTQVAPICAGGTFTLPTLSTNGISGSWSPAINNSATTTYTFTPTAGQCANSATMTVSVGPPITPAFTQIAPICAGTVYTLPAASSEGITGIWSPAINTSATTTYSFTPTAGQCANATTMTVTVNPNVTPNFVQVAPICSGGSFTLSTTSTNGITGTWSPAINTSATTTYSFTPAAGQCANTTAMTVTVNPNVLPAFTQVAPICAGGTFTLPTLSTNGISGSWSPAINNSATTTYTFTPTAGQCANSATMTVSVGPPITPAFTQLAPVCAGTLFTLPTSSNQGITGVWSPAINTSATTNYTFTPTAGQCANTASMTVTVNSNVTSNFVQVAPICSGGTFTLNTTSTNGITGTWSPAINTAATTTYTFTPTAGQCANTTSMTVTVNQQVTPTFPTYGPFCLNDVLAQVMLPETSNNGITGTWNPGMLSTDNSGVITYTFTPNAGQCASIYTSNVTVNELPIINLSTAVITNENCGQSDGSINGILLSGGGGNYQIEWNNSPQLNTLDLVNLSSGAYTLEVEDANGCMSQATLNIQGNLPPVIDASGVQIIQPSCVQNGSIQGLITNGNQPFTYSWTNSNETSISLLDASPGSYTLTVTDVNGCSTVFGPTVLNAPTGPTASFTWSPQEPSENSQVVFTDNSTGTIVNYSWSINGQSFSGEQVDYTVIEGDYTIQLTVTDDNGCSDTYTITLPVFDGLTIPNVMTLNNDGLNDFFLIEGLKSETNLTILNRWGEIVFSTNNYQNDWNGRDLSGALLTEGVYTYVLNAPNDKLKHGFIHLVR